MSAFRVAALLALLAMASAASAADSQVSVTTAAKLEQVSAQLRNAAENLGVVETQYVARRLAPRQLDRRFSDRRSSTCSGRPTASVLFTT